MKNKIFAYTVLGLNVLTAWASWWVLARAISGQSSHSWLYPVLAFSVWGIVFALACVFVKNKTYLYSSFIFSGLGNVFFWQTGGSFLVAVATAFLFVFAEGRVKKEIERGVRIDFYHLVSHSLKYFVTTVCLAAAVTYYFSITSGSAPSVSGIEAKSLETEFDWGLKAAGYVLSDDRKKLAEDIRNNVTVDEFLTKNWINQNEISNFSNQENNIPSNPSETAMLIGDTTAAQIKEEMLSRSKSDLSKQLGVPVIGERPVKEVLMAYIDKTERSFFEYSGSEKYYVPIILAFGLFLTARILATAVDIFLGLFILLIIKLLRTFGIVEISQEQKEVAMIEYSV